MAHPCCCCGGECYCHGDIDDCIVSLTPGNCRGCEDCEDPRSWEWHHDDDDQHEATMETHCPTCNREFDAIDYEYQRCHHCKAENLVEVVSEAERRRVCGCHDRMACMHSVMGPCWWAEAASIKPDGSEFVGPLCSHCAMHLKNVIRPWQDNGVDNQTN